jgi:glycosyltransferase involved in cell wall biosynthesis
MLVDAIARLQPETRRNIRLKIVGDGPEGPALNNQIHDLNLQNQVELVGKVEPTKMPEFYSKADLFCFPSIREFGGAVVMEAMAGGCPCIVANNGGIGEYVDPTTGIRINPENRESVVSGFQSAIEDLYQNPERRNRLARRAWMHAQQFTWSAKARTILQIMESVIERRNGVRPAAA